ncbi:hypothetical protein CBR_g12945 [Chara braunii]|uniref:Peptidase A2 domain-containing protein n=1 Tax=Chara braunii TaxID=69332 RepID=A0A388KTA4_CHABU|nr:hypothetical protein CBR_g12945 [Chara braunii]|eukprot:GBG73228.1 hypothetical protein CBR_g12945 [Chara braunii]
MPRGVVDGVGKVLIIDALVEALDKRERLQSNVPKVNIFHFNGERVSQWLKLVEQALVGLLDAVKFQRILKYVLHGYHQEVDKVITANDSWARFKDGMQRKYRLGDGLLTTVDLEVVNRDDFTTVGTFVQEFKKKARKVPRILKEAQCAMFLGLFTASEASELTSHGGESAQLTWVTIDKGLEEGSLNQVEQYQIRQQRWERKERNATSSGTPGMKTIVTDVLVELGYGKDAVVQKKVVATIQGKGKEPMVEEVVQEEWEEEESGDNDLVILKEILAFAPKLLNELKGRFSRRLVSNVHLSVILPKEAEWAETGTMMAWKCVLCGMVDLVVKGLKCAAMVVDTGAEMNIIKEFDALRFGLEMDRSDCGILHGANCKVVFYGTASNMLVEIGRVKARACFSVMPDVDHAILLGRSFLCRTETLMFNKHNETLILILCDSACGNNEIVTCQNTGPRSIRNRPNPGSFTIEESGDERRRLREEPEEEAREEVFSLGLSDVNKAMDVVATHEMADPDAIQTLREQVLECPQAGEVKLVYRLPGERRNPAMMQAQADLQRLNDVTVRDAGGLPNIDACQSHVLGGL